MHLFHYTEDPLAYDPARTYEQNEPRSFGKPKGLWVSVQGEDDWLSWCTDNEFATYALAHVSEVTLAPDANVLMLDTVDAIVAFHDRYSVEDTGWLPPRHTFSEEYVWKSRPIDWTPITAVYDGIIIAPYQWPCRMKYDWYYSWDVASGCIWNLSAIASVSPVDRTVEAHPDFPGYEASDLGRIKSTARVIVRGAGIQQPVRERILKQHPYPKRGVFVAFSGRATRAVHRLVLEAFVGPRPPGHECCHLDDDATNNRLDNLRWDTRSANQLDAVRNNRHARASRTHCIHGHEYTPENTVWHGPEHRWRRCLTCLRARRR